MSKPKKRTAEIGDYVEVHWVDHCEYEDVPLAHESFRLIKFRTLGRLDHIDHEKLHLTRSVQDSEDSAKNIVLIVGRGMVTKLDLYEHVGEVNLPE